MEALLQDIRYSARLLFKSPAFTLVAILTLTLAIGANSAIFSVLDAVVFRPLPYSEPERLVMLWNEFPGQKLSQVFISSPEILDIAKQNQVFESVTPYLYPSTINLNQNGEAEQLEVARVGGNFFTVLGRKAALGRTFTADESDPGHGEVAILSEGLWRRRFGSDPKIIGSKLVLDGTSYTTVGVMPGDVRMPANVDLWVPLTIDPANLPPRGVHTLKAIARLKSGVTVERGQAGAKMLAQWMQQHYLHEYPKGDDYTMTIQPLQEFLVGKVKVLLILLFGSVGLLLLIACANLGNLFLARTQARQQEIAVRSALGAGRLQMVRQLLTESLLLSLVGGAFGLLLGHWGTRLLVALSSGKIPRAEEIGVNKTVLLFTLGVSVLTSLLFGLAPVIHFSRQDLTAPLKDSSGRWAIPSSGGRILRNTLLVSQVALALLLVTCAGLVVKGFLRLQKVDPGFRTENLLTVKISPPTTKYDLNQRVALYEQVIEKFKTAPGVKEVGTINFLPLSGINFSGSFEIEGRPVPTGELPPEADRRAVSPGYFHAMGIPLLAGRTFNAQDRDEPELGVVIVDEQLAKRYWPDLSPVGRRVRTASDKPWLQVVGVVGHVQHQGPGEGSREEIYFPSTQVSGRSMYFVVKSYGDPLALVSALKARMAEIDPGLPLYDIQTMEQRFGAALSTPRFASVLLAIFASVALVLAAVGIFGLTTYSVSQRTREIGIRMAIGARRGEVLSLIVRQAMKLTLIGLAIGLLAAVATTRLFSSMLYGVSALDPVVLLLVVLILGAVALVACSLPAMRATKVDPTSSLRQV